MQADVLITQRAEMLKICFIAGLHDRYQKKLREIPGLTYAQAQLYARQYRAVYNYDGSRNSERAHNSKTVTSTSISVNDRVSALESSFTALILSTTTHYTGRDATIK